MEWCHTSSNQSHFGVEGVVSVSVLFLHLAFEDNRSTNFDLTSTENVVQEAGMEWDGLKLITVFWSSR